MIVYMCDIKRCNNFKKREEHMNKITIRTNSGRTIDKLVCDNCLNKILTLLDSEEACEYKKDTKQNIETDAEKEPKVTKEADTDAEKEPKVTKEAASSIEKHITHVGGANTEKEHVIAEETKEAGNNIEKHVTHVGGAKGKRQIEQQTLEDKVRNYGIDKLELEYTTGECSIDELAEKIGVKAASLRVFLSRNNIRKTRKRNIDAVEKDIATVSNESKADIKGEPKRAILSGKQLEKFETEVEVKSGICLTCAYRNKGDGACDYTLKTGKGRRGGKNRCMHYVNLGEIQ